MNDPPPPKFRDPALVDFGADAAGHGRRLERLGGVLVDRPLPHAVGSRHAPALWSAAAAVFNPVPGDGGWTFNAPLPDPWLVTIPLATTALTLEVRPAPSGQFGIFLEQVAQWQWLAAVTPPGAVVLSLFGHSGAASLALAAAGAEVVHVDASRQALALARRNAETSGLDHLPIRWIHDDAAAFVRRQLRRGRGFSGAVIDPPSWGHGPRGEAFAIDRDLPSLLDDVARLLAVDRAPSPGPLLLTSHSPGWHPRRLRDTLLSTCTGLGLACAGIEDGPLACVDERGRPLALGGFARCRVPA